MMPHNQSDVTAPLLMEDPRQVTSFDYVMGIVLPGVLCVLGIVGNLVSLVVLSSSRSRCPTFVTLKALAVSDVILLLFALFQQVIPVYIVYVGCTNAFCRHIGFVRIYAWPVICVAQMASVWLTVVISAERYSAICRPLHANGFCTINKVKVAIVVVFVTSVTFNIPRFFEFYPYHVTYLGADGVNLTIVDPQGTELRLDPVYRFLYNTALHLVLVYALPLCVITVLNCTIVHHMRKARHRWTNLNRQQQREVKATAIPLCIVAVFFVCGTQALVIFVLDAIYVNSDALWLQHYTAVVNLFVIFNSAVNFIIFYMFGSKFRRLLRHLVTCQGHRAGSDLSIRGSPILRRQFTNPRLDYNGHVTRSRFSTSEISFRQRQESFRLEEDVNGTCSKSRGTDGYSAAKL